MTDQPTPDQPNADPPTPDDGIDPLYAELRAVAARQFRGQRVDHTLQATALVHEAWIRLSDRDPDEYADRGHFLATAARAMRHVLVDHARRSQAVKRGGDQQRVTLLTGDGADAGPTMALDVLDLDVALNRLEQSDERQARVVELRFFAGMSIPQIAEAVGVSHMTVSNDWRRARVWLARELGS